MNLKNGLEHLAVWYLALDPRNTSTLYVTTAIRKKAGIYKTVNGGQRWTPVNTGLKLTGINSVVVDPSDSAVVFAAGTGGAYKSNNGGVVWSPVNDGLVRGRVGTRMNIVDLVVDPSNPAILYAAVYFGKVFKSVNGGANWTSLGNGPEGVRKFAIDPSRPSTIYALDLSSVFKTSNGGKDWSKMSNGLRASGYPVLAIDPKNPRNLYVGSDEGLFKSGDAGATWSQVPSVGFTKRFR